MSLFDFENTFTEAYKNVEEKGISIYYADVYDVNENIVCIQTPDGTIYDKNNYKLEDQNRYQYMIDINALKEVRTEIYEGETYKVNPWGIVESTDVDSLAVKYKSIKKKDLKIYGVKARNYYFQYEDDANAFYKAAKKIGKNVDLIGANTYVTLKDI